MSLGLQNYIISWFLLSIHLVISKPPLGFYPNIIMFYADDYGFGDMQAYGNPLSLTPNLDAIVSEGIKFTAFYSSAPVCSPSRAALLTGRFQTRSGIWPGVLWDDSIGGLPLNEVTIAEFLKLNGLNYSTAAIGKWHLGTGGQNYTYLPTKQGFDFYTGVYLYGAPNPPYCFPNKRGCWPNTAIDPWNDTCPDSNDLNTINSNKNINNLNYKEYIHQIDIINNNDYNHNLKDETPALALYYMDEVVQQPVNITMIPEWYTNSALSFISSSIDSEQPFFLYMAYHETHHPQFSSAKFFNTSQRGMFGDSVREMDYNIGLIMDYIKQRGLENTTFVFFSADNGPSLMRETRGGNAGLLKCGKGTTYEGGMRVPGVAWMPKFIKRNRVVRGLASTLDILPTIADIVGESLPNDRYYDGVSMYDMIFNEGKSLRNTFYYWPKNPNPNFGWQQSLYAVRINQWKLHWITEGSHANNNYYDHDCRNNNSAKILKEPILYNLYHDPGENYPVNISLPYYMNIVKEINESWSFILNTNGLWGESQVNRGQNTSDGPCCFYNCNPWPQCCNCNRINGTWPKFQF